MTAKTRTTAAVVVEQAVLVWPHKMKINNRPHTVDPE
jgi:hypothetical protein